MDPTRPALALALAAILGGCAHAGGAMRCAADAQPMAQERLYFGTQRPSGIVSDAEWNAFLDEVVANAFPAGFTTWNAAGAWRGAEGRTVREASHVVEVAHPADASAEPAISKVIATYKARFDQEAVMRVRAPACVSFR
jgi:hypothetical protein